MVLVIRDIEELQTVSQDGGELRVLETRMTLENSFWTLHSILFNTSCNLVSKLVILVVDA